MSKETNIQKYAYAEVIEAGEPQQWMVPLYDTGPIGKVSVPVNKDAQSHVQAPYGSNEWVEPRLNFDDLLVWMDMNVWHKRSVFLKAAVMCGLGWTLETDDEDKEPDAAHAAITEFLERPNEDPMDSFTRIAFRSAVDLEAIGNFVNEASRAGTGRIGNLYHQRAVNFRRGKRIKEGRYYQISRAGGKTVEFNKWGMRGGGRNEILHYYTYDPCSDYYGMPIWVPSLADMVLDRSAVEFNINLFRNQLVAKFAVVVEGGKLSPESRLALRDFLKSQATGVHNAGKTIVLDTDDPQVKIKIEKLELELGEKNNFMERVREQARDMVVAAHGIPPRMLGIAEAGVLGGSGELLGQLKIFGENEVGPHQNMIETFYNRTIISSFGAHKWRLRFKAIDHTDKKLDAEVEQILTAAGIKLRTESRQDLELPILAEEDLPAPPAGGGEIIQLEKKLSRIRKELELRGDY